MWHNMSLLKSSIAEEAVPIIAYLAFSDEVMGRATLLLLAS
jgi:hypothetical protein